MIEVHYLPLKVFFRICNKDITAGVSPTEYSKALESYKQMSDKMESYDFERRMGIADYFDLGNINAAYKDKEVIKPLAY